MGGNHRDVPRDNVEMATNRLSASGIGSFSWRRPMCIAETVGAFISVYA